MHPQISGVNTYFRETCKGNWRVGEGEGCNIASQNCAALTSVGLATGIIIRSAEDRVKRRGRSMHFEAATTGPVYQFEPGLTFQRCCHRGTAGKIGSSLLSSALATAHPPTTQNRPSPPVRVSSCVSTGLDIEDPRP